MLDEIARLEDGLMEVEMKLSEALLTATTEFQEKVKAIIEEMKQKTSAL
jgi:hypothetical protein